MHSDRWTINDLITLEELLSSVPVREIARQLGRTEHAVYNMAHRRGWPALALRYGRTLDAQVRELAGQGWSSIEIARELDCGRHTIWRIRRRLGRQAVGLQPTAPNAVQRLIDMANRHATLNVTRLPLTLETP